ncbi:MAG: enoyl-CoA hydratase [Nitrospinota bacterium]
MQLKTEKMLAEVEDGIGWMTFNQPERRNALSLEMWEAIAEIIDAFSQDDGVRVVVMKGAGDKAFVSGADISQFGEKRSGKEQVEHYSDTVGRCRRRLADLEKPLIAMIRGYCLGGGLTVALNADIRIASEDSHFGVPAARLGIAYGFEAMNQLVALVGPSHAKEMLFSARRLPAEEALRIGLVNRVVPAGQLEATVREIAGTIAGNAPLSIRAAKLTIGAVLKDPSGRDMAALDRLTKTCFESQDYVEGRTAFMEKRKPNFTGR